jgi:electron transport complex protein RnfG
MTETDKISPLLVLTWASVLVVSALLLTVTHQLTKTRIAENRQQAMLKVLRQIIPGQYNNDVFKDTIQIIEPGFLGTDRPVTVYRSRNGDMPLGVVFSPVIAKGYNGPIQLGIGISSDGTVTGVRVMKEEETEGLGAEVNQQNSDWIMTFTGQSYQTVPREQWDVSTENGYFDQISGATITSRSVINAVRNTLDYHDIARDSLNK